MSEKILIVDDDAGNVRLLESMVRMAGYAYESADSGEAALSWMANEVPMVVLLDIKMPEMDGYEVCRRMRENPATVDVPVLFVTAIGGQIDMIQVDEVGAQGYLVKPVRVNQLKAAIDELL
jgi:DNA-binding response OmpR family regulator